MPQPCKICRHADCQAIDAVLVEGWPSLRAIGTQYGVSKDSLSRHFHAHLRDSGDDNQDGEPRQISDLSEQKKESDESRQISEITAQKKEPDAAPTAIGSPEWWAAVDELFGRMKTDAGGA